MINTQFIQQNQQNQSTWATPMYESARTQGFYNQPKKNLKMMAQALGLKDNQKKNDLSQQILNQLIETIQKCSNQNQPILIKCDHIALKQFPILQNIFNHFSQLMQKTQKDQTQKIQLPTQQIQQQQFIYQPRFTPIPYNMNMGQNIYQNQLQGMQTIQQMQLFEQQQMYQPPIEHAAQCVCQYLPRLRTTSNDNPENIVLCQNSNCGKKFHMSCLNIKSQDQKNTFECPQCVLQNFDPMNKVQSVLVQCMPLKQGIHTQCQFLLNEEQYITLIKNNLVQGLEVRCIRFDNKIMYEPTWPDYGEMEINQNKVMEFKPLQSNSSLKKRKDEKFYLKSPQILQIGQNTITIRELTAYNEQKQNFKITDMAVYVFGVYIVRKYHNAEIIKQISTSNLRSIKDCQDLIKEQLKQQENKDDVQIDKLRITLICNFDFKIINTPTKGRWCKHAQCFSLENMILVTEGQVPRKWKCPICKLKCYDLIVDQYVLKIINEVKDNQLKVEDVTFDQDGIYHLQLKNKKEEISDDDSDKEMQIEKNKTVAKKSEQVKLSVIILSDEEEIVKIDKQLPDKPNQNDIINYEVIVEQIVKPPQQNDDFYKKLIQYENIDKKTEISNSFHEKMEYYQQKKYDLLFEVKSQVQLLENQDFDQFCKKQKIIFNEYFVEKIPSIAQHKIIKGVKKHHPEVISIIRKEIQMPVIEAMEIENGNFNNLQQNIFGSEMHKGYNDEFLKNNAMFQKYNYNYKQKQNPSFIRNLAYDLQQKQDYQFIKQFNNQNQNPTTDNLQFQQNLILINNQQIQEQANKYKDKGQPTDPIFIDLEDD